MKVPKSKKKPAEKELAAGGSAGFNEFNSKFNQVNQANATKSTNVNTPQTQAVNKTIDPNLIASGLGLAASGLSALNAGNTSTAQYGTNPYFEKQAKQQATSDALASGVAAAATPVVPYAPQTLELLKQLANTIDPKDAYGVSKKYNPASVMLGDLLGHTGKGKTYKDWRNAGDSQFESWFKSSSIARGLYKNLDNAKQLQQLKTDYNNGLKEDFKNAQSAEIQGNIDDAINRRNAGITSYVDTYKPKTFDEKTLLDTNDENLNKNQADVDALNRGLNFDDSIKKGFNNTKSNVGSFFKKNNFASKYFAKGGEIKGNGTGKSDSITAKVEEGAFVVPVENAAKAKAIKEELLETPADEAAELEHPNGVDVKLSNGEFMFSKEEADELKNMGIDLYKEFAPNSNDLKDGGLTAGKAKIMLHEGVANGKKITDSQRKYFAWVAGGRKANGGIVNAYKEGGEVKEYANGGSPDGGNDDFVKAELARIESERKADAKRMGEAQAKAKAERAKADVKYKAYQLKVQQAKEQKEADAAYKKAATEVEALKKSYAQMTADQKKAMEYNNPNEKYIGVSSKPTLEENRRNQEDLLKKIAAKEAELNSAKQKLDYASNEGNYLNSETLYGVKKPSANTAGKINYYTGQNEPVVTTPATSTQNASGTPVNTGAKKNTYTSRPVIQSNPADVPFTPTITDNEPQLEPVSNTPAVLPWDVAAKEQPMTINGQDVATMTTPYVAPTTPAVTDDFAAKKGMNVDWADLADKAISYGIPLAQTAIGFNNLRKAGDRPVDKLDPTFLAALNKTQDIQSKADLAARYGLSQDQLAYLNMQNVNATNAARGAARNLAGGNAAAAFNLERAASNDAYGRALQSRVLDTDLKLQKQQIAADRQNAVNNMAWQKQQQNRLLFGDALNAWQQKTANAAALANTGMTNFLDTYNADKRMKNYNELMKQANQYGG